MKNAIALEPLRHWYLGGLVVAVPQDQFPQDWVHQPLTVLGRTYQAVAMQWRKGSDILEVTLSLPLEPSHFLDPCPTCGKPLTTVGREVAYFWDGAHPVGPDYLECDSHHRLCNVDLTDAHARYTAAMAKAGWVPKWRPE